MRVAPRPGVRGLSLFGSARHVIGIDIGSHSVKLAVVRHDAAGWSIEAVAQRVLPPDALHGHAVREPGTIAAAIRPLIPRVRRRATVRIAIPAPTVMMRQLTVRADGAAARDAEVVRAVTAHIPAPLEQTVLDYRPLASLSSDDTGRVLVVAARRELVQSYTAAARAAGVEPAVVDVDVFAIARLVRGRHTPPGDVVIVHAGARYAGISRLQAGVPHWIGDVPVEAGMEPDVLARTVDRALALFSPEEPAPPGAVLLSGGMVAAPGMVQAFAARFGCLAELIDPFAGARGGGPEYTVAVGLAVDPPEAGR